MDIQKCDQDPIFLMKIQREKIPWTYNLLPAPTPKKGPQKKDKKMEKVLK